MKAILILILMAAAPAMADTMIPKYVDPQTGYINEETASVIDWANENYSEENRAEVVRFCNEEAAKRVGAASFKGKLPPGVVREMKEEFQYCAEGMIKAWESQQ